MQAGDALFDVGASLDTFWSGTFEQRSEGVTTWKLLHDLDRYRHVIEATRPEVVVETGTKFGGSARWFEQQGVDVVTVDVDAESSRGARALCSRVTWVTGDSTSPAVVERVRDLTAGRRVMVSLDSEHAAPHVAAEIRLYGPLVTPGCYLVVEDGIFDLADERLKARGGLRIPAEGGPLAAIGAELVGSDGWVRDEDVERMHATSHHPMGWWRRG
jgi:cephalosporin hydroxylase